MKLISSIASTRHPGSKHTSSFSKCLDAHHSWQNRSILNLVIMKEWLSRRIQRRFDGVAVVKTHGGDPSHHGANVW